MSVATEASTSETNTGVGDGVISAKSWYVLLGSTITSLLSRCVGRTGTCNSNTAKDGELGTKGFTHTHTLSVKLCNIYNSTDNIIVSFRTQQTIIHTRQQMYTIYINS